VRVFAVGAEGGEPVGWQFAFSAVPAGSGCAERRSQQLERHPALHGAGFGPKIPAKPLRSARLFEGAGGVGAEEPEEGGVITQSIITTLYYYY